MFVLGYASYSFADKTTGKQIDGYSIYLGQPVNAEKGKGYLINEKLFKLSVSKEKLISVLDGLTLDEIVGKNCDPLFNSYHKLEQLRVVKK